MKEFMSLVSHPDKKAEESMFILSQLYVLKPKGGESLKSNIFEENYVEEKTHIAL